MCYCLPNIDFPKGLRLIRNELDYSTFIAIAYECHVILLLYVDHFDETGHTDDNGNPYFLQNDNEAECDMRDNVGECEPVNDDMGENEDDEDDVDTNLPNICNEKKPWKEQQHVLRKPESVRQTQESVKMVRGGEDVATGDADREDIEMADASGQDNMVNKQQLHFGKVEQPTTRKKYESILK
ncbi:unnamed protein product [Lactuca saligna]|uniref:Uncharacterized protein n=1 Tax=Lactuca saligna TaxID=75948 RepID=A0AA35ZTV4_LACSI|nr:unnamed protein product [Lactuca saligna]